MRLRKEKGLTQEELSEMIGISKNHLSGIECGKYTPTTQFIIDLCNVLGRTPDYYLIGQVSDKTDMLTNLIRGLPEREQVICIKLLETYIIEHKNNL